MRRSKLGKSDLQVSSWCLGTMTFGSQTAAPVAFDLLDLALENGINFIDSAEMYPAPALANTYGESERIIGRWLARRGRRDDVVLATKASGPGAFVPWIREGRSNHCAAHLTAAADASLARMGTDYIDLYQLHWPDRAANFFGQLGFKPARQEASFDVEESVAALAALVSSGKVRHVGLCNETAWGTMQFLNAARRLGVAEIVSVQNPFNLLNRSLEVGLAEVTWREGCSVIGYSPLAFGMLTGKYLDNSAAADARLNRHRQYRRYSSKRALAATSRYLAIAREASLDPTHMALAWSASKPYVGSVIIGASDCRQLQHNLLAHDLELSRDVLKAIDAVHEEISNPCP